jgi:hypothetical protein
MRKIERFDGVLATTRIWFVLCDDTGEATPDEDQEPSHFTQKQKSST